MLEVDFADARFCEFIKITAMSPSESSIARHVRRIQLVSLIESRSAYGSSGPPVMNKVKKFMTAEEEKIFADQNVGETMQYDIYPEEEIKKCLVPFLERLTNVNTLT